MRVMLVSSRGIVLLQFTVQDLWNIAWISTSHVRNSPRMRTLATEFSVASKAEMRAADNK